MQLVNATVRALVWKEMRQLRRSRGALASATLLPIFLMVVQPMIQLFALRSGASTATRPGEADLRQLVPDLDDPLRLFLNFLLPLFVTLTGLILPSVAATYTVVAERERRTLELLMALPARVRDILTAKLIATIALSLMVTIPLLTIDATALIVLGVAGLDYVALLALLLFAGLFCSTGVALLVALLTRDFRTANNVSGALGLPLVLATVGILIAVPAPLKFPAVIVALALLGGLALLVALRWLTFERYLA